MKLETSLKSWMLVSALLLAICYTSAAGQIIYVDVDANGLNDGTSWDNAYNYLQDGLADAASSPKPVEIRVAQGTYKPDQGASQTPGDRYATFQLIDGVTIKGGYAGFGEPDPNARDIELYETILSGDLAGNDVDVNEPRELYDEPSRAENSYHVTTIYDIEETVVFDGFTIIAGNANGYPWEYSSGGGLFNRPFLGGRPTITNCTFTQNSARRGGGMYNWQNNSVVNNCRFASNGADDGGGGIYDVYGSPEFRACTFIGNSAECGGGIVSWDSNPIVNDCLFIGNSADFGGAILNVHSKPKLNNCMLVDNSAELGGGINNSNCDDVSLKNCKIKTNSATVGGGIYGYLSETTLSNCILAGNSATAGGAISFDEKSKVTVNSCTFNGNLATYGDAVGCYSYFGSKPSKYDIRNCILWDGCGEIWNNDGSEIIISYSDVQGGEGGIYDPCNGLVWGAGNIDVDPCFADANNSDFHLKSQAGRWDPNSDSWVRDDVTSPCIDAGDPASPIGYEPFPNGGIINMGTYGETAEASKSYFGEPLCETIVAGDINGDCIVNFKDFALMACHWLEQR